MRLFNFSIIGGQESVANLSTAGNLVVSGTGGSELDRVRSSLYGFTSHYSVGEDPYGNAKLYNGATINTPTELALSQSFSATMTESALVDFILIADKNHRG